MVAEPPVGRVKAEIERSRPLQDVNGEHFELRTGSGLGAKNPIDVGVRDGASTGPGVEKVPKTAGDVPVRYAPLGPVRTRYAAPSSSTPWRCAARTLTLT